MTVAVLVLLVLVLGLGVAVMVLWLRLVPGVLSRRERRQWVVTLKSGEAFRGVLADHDAASLVLTDAEHYADPQSPVPVDGEIVVLLADVKYAQRL